jgi:hypothetical protein
MLPDTGLASSVPVKGRFLSSDHRRIERMVDWERAGVAINDASQGHNVRDWKVHVEPNTNDVVLTPEGGEPAVLFNAHDITEIALTFDRNMRPAVAYVQEGVLKLRWYDTTIPAYSVLSFGGEARNPKLTLDDKRRVRSFESDMILAYIRDQALHYRQQRDRFEIEYTLKTGLAPDEELVNIGMSRNWRLQFQMI